MNSPRFLGLKGPGRDLTSECLGESGDSGLWECYKALPLHLQSRAAFSPLWLLKFSTTESAFGPLATREPTCTPPQLHFSHSCSYAMQACDLGLLPALLTRSPRDSIGVFGWNTASAARCNSCIFSPLSSNSSRLSKLA